MNRSHAIILCCLTAFLCAVILASGGPNRGIVASLSDAETVWGGTCYTPNETNNSTACTDCGASIKVPSIFDDPTGVSLGSPTACEDNNDCTYTPHNGSNCGGSGG